MNVEQARFNMIEQQIRPSGILNQEVLDLFYLVKRENFVPASARALAFAEMQIPLPGGQCLLTPQFEARLLQELALRPGEQVLEIGSGSGHLTALLATAVQDGQVTSLEIDPVLADLARENLAKNGISNARIETANGLSGWPAGAPYNAIVLSGSLDAIPSVLLEQLAPGGRLLAVVGSEPAQQLQRWQRHSDGSCSPHTLGETRIPALRATASKAFTF